MKSAENSELIKKKFRRFSIIMLIIVIILFSVMMFVNAADTWDRPITAPFNFTYYNITITAELQNLQSQIDNETASRISNDTRLNSSINNLSYNLQTYYYTSSQSDNLFYLKSNPSGYINDTYLQSQLIILNTSIYIDIDYLINYTDYINASLSQLYGLITAMNDTINNHTVSIITLNQSVNTLNQSVNALNQSVIVMNQSIKQPTGQYLSFNSSNFWINETALNTTVNDIAKNKKNLYTITMYNTSEHISVMNISYLITSVNVYTVSNNYRLQVTEYPSGNMIEKDRIPHQNNWSIEKNYAVNSLINISITGNGIFNVTVEYITNGNQ
jgi:hypothetical protein